MFWLVIRLLAPLQNGAYLGAFAALVVGMASFVIAHPQSWRERWKIVLVGLVLAEVFFALTFWSTPPRNKALILVMVVFFFDQWFDRIEERWIIAFLLILLGALLLVPFQAL